MATDQEIEAARKRFHGSCNRDMRYIGMASGDEELGRGLRLADAEILADEFINQQSQPVNERLLTAAKNIQLLIGGQGQSDELDGAIAAAEAQAEYRKRPVTDQWLRSVGGTADPYGNEHDDTHPIAFQSIPPFKVDVLRHGWSIGFCGCEGFPTRGDVLDLLRILGGAT